jgi:hypothetical protein
MNSIKVKTISADAFSQAKVALIERFYSAQNSLGVALEAYGADHVYAKFWQGEMDRVTAAIEEFKAGGVVA